MRSVSVQSSCLACGKPGVGPSSTSECDPYAKSWEYHLSTSGMAPKQEQNRPKVGICIQVCSLSHIPDIITWKIELKYFILYPQGWGDT